MTTEEITEQNATSFRTSSTASSIPKKDSSERCKKLALSLPLSQMDFEDEMENIHQKCDNYNLEKILYVTPSLSPMNLSDAKIINYNQDDNYYEETPLLYSRSSSLGSLSGNEHQTDQRSIHSDVEFPLKEQDMSIFEDSVEIFKEESTPINLRSRAASSLSSITIDDEEATVIKNLDFENYATSQVNKIKYFSTDEEKIISECIKKGIAKVTHQSFDDTQSIDGSSELTEEEENLIDECIVRGIAKITHQNVCNVKSMRLRLKMKTNKDNEEVDAQTGEIDQE